MKQLDAERSGFSAIRSNSGAFTSIELVVIITVLVVLAAVIFPALARSKERDIRIICVNNEKQLYTSLQMYCDDNGDGLPQRTGGDEWPWDLSPSATTSMINSGCIKKTFYCPSTAPRFNDQINWATANSLWYYFGGWSLAGYSFALGGSSSTIDPQYQNLILLTELHPNGAIQVADSPSTREVIADVMLSNGSTLPATGADNFSSIVGGYTVNGVTYPHLSAHLGRGQVPAGGNIAFKDGHVQWRKFDASNLSAVNNPTRVRTGSYAPHFWW